MAPRSKDWMQERTRLEVWCHSRISGLRGEQYAEALTGVIESW